MKFSPQKIRAVMALTGPERYSHFVKVAADLRSVWGLYSNGWALAKDVEGRDYLPIWPAAPYAAECAVSEWAEYQPREIDLDELFEIVIPRLKELDASVAIFPTLAEKGIVPEFDMLEADLREELSRIE